MGTTTAKIREMQARRLAYQEKKKKEAIDRIASYLTEEERKILYSGDGFIRVPREEFMRQRIDSYPCLVP